MNLYQNAKNEAISSICFGEIVDLKIWLAESILAYISMLESLDLLDLRNKIFPSMTFVQKYNK